MEIKEKEAIAIINSLTGGVVPKLGIQHIVVGRKDETNAIISSLEDVKNGHSLMKFWVGDYGSGKSFMLHLLNVVAIKNNFVVANAEFTPENRLYASDWKSVSLYTMIIDNLAVKTKPEGGALQSLLEKWIEKVIIATAEQNNIALSEIRDEQYLSLIQHNLFKTIDELTDAGGFDFGTVIMKYYEAYITGDDAQRKAALKWLKGEYRTKTEARQDLGVREIITDGNYYDMLKNFCKLFVQIGYSGFIINLDEAINLYRISTTATRDKNYEKILTIYNECYQGKISNLFINIAGTNEVLENERRGIFSYKALKSRLYSNKFETLELRDFSQPVLKLFPLDDNEIYVLLKNLKDIFDLRYKVNVNITNEEILAFMQDLYNRPGAKEFLTPREVIRDFINVLNIIRQNPNIEKTRIFADIEISDERENESEIEVI